jgi:D-alanyl-D-alanine carboxypeptidase (penicillin-binding protein 5/6)
MAVPGQEFGSLTVKKGKADQVNVVAAEKGGVLSLKSKAGGATSQLELPGSITAPVEAGQQVGELVIYNQQQEFQRVKLIAESDVPRSSFMDFFKKIMVDMAEL